MEQYDDYEGYVDLANAIIAQAVEDYLNTKKQLHVCPKQFSSERHALTKELKRIEKFFRSDWFTVLSDIDGEALLHKLNGLYETWKKEMATAS